MSKIPEYVEAKDKLDKLAERWTKEIEDRYAAIKKKLNAQLMAELKRTNDPRVKGDGSTFDKSPFVAEFKRPQRNKNSKQKKE